MKAKGSSLLAAFLAALLTVLSISPISASAAYENTHRNTGNQRNDIVAVAVTQLGYREGNNNDTKYGDWYGMSNQPWCAMFVSWCADQAGISTNIIKKNAKAHPTYFGLSAKSGSSYTPRSGDLFFCKRNGSYAHAGIVYYVDGDYFYTIEGNASNSGSFDGTGVFSLKRKISACYFASPSYLGNTDCTYVQGYDSAHPHKAYYKCSDCSDKYYTKDYGTLEDCQTCIMENCQHQFGSWAETDSDHSRSCGLCTLTETEKHDWSVKVLQKADCTQSGAQEKTCKVCSAFISETVPQSTKHSFSAWQQVDDANHSRACSVCQKAQVSAHTFDQEWTSDETGHYKQCTGCGFKSEVTAHDFSENCEAGCTQCGYIGESVHAFSTQLRFDEENHWYECDNCEQSSQLLSHSFDNSCDTKCNDCDYTRQTTHSFGEQWLSDESWHWIECTVCGYVKDHAKHSADNTLADANCEQCGYLIPHVHTYDTILRDEESHWGVCICSAEEAAAAHQWNDNRICPICQAEKPVEIWVWILMISAPLLILAGVFVFLFIRSRRKPGLYV